MENTTVHLALGLIFGAVMISLTAIEVLFTHVTEVGLLFIIFQNIGLGFANSYYAGQVQVQASGISEKTTSSS